jgi:hypothetical protein
MKPKPSASSKYAVMDLSNMNVGAALVKSVLGHRAWLVRLGRVWESLSYR